MVERLLVLVVVMVLAVLGMSAERVSDVQTKRSFTNVAPLWDNKGSQHVNMILPSLLRSAHSPDGRESYARQIEEGSVTPPKVLETRKSSQDPLPLGKSPGVLNPSCLQHLRCQDEDQFYFERMEIHHADLPERSAAACGHLCLRHRPETRLVMAKLNPYNEQLVCGCGDQEALPTSPGLEASSICSQQCPDGQDSCGGPRTISVYQVDRYKEECVVPSYSYHGCYQEKEGRTVVITLGPWERWGGGCLARCRTLHNSGPLMRLTTAADGTTTCVCGVTEEELDSPVTQRAEGCGWRCPDGNGWCGGNGLTSVYSAARKQHPFSSRFLLLLLLTLVLSFVCHDVLG